MEEGKGREKKRVNREERDVFFLNLGFLIDGVDDDDDDDEEKSRRRRIIIGWNNEFEMSRLWKSSEKRLLFFAV